MMTSLAAWLAARPTIVVPGVPLIAGAMRGLRLAIFEAFDAGRFLR